MRAVRFGIVGVVAMALVSTSAVASPPPSPEASASRLSGRSARDVAEKLVSRAVKRSPRLDTAAFRECDRRLGRTDCLFIVHGQTPNAEFDCRFKVVVRGHRHRSGRIVARTCQETLRPLLTSARAREAIASISEARGGSDSLIELDRISRSAFNGYAAWPADTERGPVCVLKLSAELVPTGAVLVQTHGVTCAA